MAETPGRLSSQSSSIVVNRPTRWSVASNTSSHPKQPNGESAKRSRTALMRLTYEVVRLAATQQPGSAPPGEAVHPRLQVFHQLSQRVDDLFAPGRNPRSELVGVFAQDG